jgi:hypothetical protein
MIGVKAVWWLVIMLRNSRRIQSRNEKEGNKMEDMLNAVDLERCW